MVEMGVVHGRFQVFHNDHLKYVLAGKSRCHHIVVGITNPDPMLTRVDHADSQRSESMSNPLTYFERHVMIRAALLDAGLNHSEFTIVPLPINIPELYQFYVPLDATFYLTIYDAWGRTKLDQFQSMGLETEVLWTRPLEQKGLSSSDIRRRMTSGDAWEHMVPPAISRLTKACGLPDRLRKLHEMKCPSAPTRDT